MRALLTLPLFVCALVATTVAPLSAAELPDAATIKKLFANPPREYSSAPLWVWNDMLTEEQIRQTMNDLAEQKVKQVFVHPRPGLMTPYLSADWFRLWKVALKEAERLDMNVWIYDENSYPSGFAGGHVPEAMPESRGRGLHFTEGKQPKLPAQGLLAVFQLDGDKASDMTKQATAKEKLPEGKHLVAEVRRAANNPWHGNRSYVDILYPGVTQKFLDVTLEPYRREFGNEFGKRIPGSFTDEPHLRPAGGLPWTDDLPQEFQKRYGYSLTENLASLVRPVGEWKKVRHDYYKLLLELMIDRWAKPYYEYCEKHKLEFTGHYWEHEWPRCVSVPDNMALYAWHQRPSIDCLMNQYATDTHAQFGNVRAVKELSSVANQLGRKRTLCELYGAGGWDLRFEDMKRIADWLAVLGVNTMDEHLSYITIRGARKWDHPQSFSYHEPWWDSYHKVAEYLTRLSLVASAGEQVNRVLVLEPTSTAWLYQSDPTQAAKLKQLGDEFQLLLNELEKAQVEYDIGCEDIIARHGSVKDKQLVVGKRAYDIVIIPPGMENLNGKVVELLQKFPSKENVTCRGEAPTLIDGRPISTGMKVGKPAGWSMTDTKMAVIQSFDRMLREATARKELLVHVHETADSSSMVFHQRRRLANGELVLLVNASITATARGWVTAEQGMPSKNYAFEAWSLEDGQCREYPSYTEKIGNSAKFTLPPCGSMVLFVSRNVGRVWEDTVESRLMPAVGELTIARKDPNVLALDHFDVTAGGQTRQNLHCYQACQFAFKQNGMERNPWDSAVQFKDELITKMFPPESGCAATYRFSVEERVPKDLCIVIERSDLYAITCNGQQVKALPDQWWLDRAFGKIDLAKVAKVGKNEVTITAKPFTIYHELMPAYVLGDFSLKPIEKGFAIAPPQPLKLGKWNEQGLPLFGHGVGYTQTFEVEKPSGRYAVKLGSANATADGTRSVPATWHGSVAKVVVNGKPAGTIGWAPWTCDVTEAIRPGKNTIEVVIIGTLRNTLGPHHAGPVAGKAWPHDFRKAPELGPPPGAQYNTLPYGLYEPFVLEQVVE